MSSEVDGFKIYFTPWLDGCKRKKGTWYYHHWPHTDEIIQAAIDSKKAIGFRIRERSPP